MDPVTGTTAIAALITAIAAWRKSGQPDREIQRLRTEVRAQAEQNASLKAKVDLYAAVLQQATVNQQPTINIAFHPPLPPLVQTERTEGDAQLSPKPTYQLGSAAAEPIQSEPLIADPSKKVSES